MNSHYWKRKALLIFVATFAFGFAGSFLLTRKGANTVRIVAIDSTPDTTVGDSIADTTSALGLDSTVASDSTIAVTEPPPVTTAATKPPKPTTPQPRSTPPLTTDGAFLSQPESPEPRQLNPDDQCASLSGTGAADICDLVSIGGRSYGWVFIGGGQGVDLLTGDPELPDVFTVGLRSGSIPTQKPRFVDVTGDGQPDIVLGWRGDDGGLDVDIVEIRNGSLVVTLHLHLVDGRLSAGGGSLDAWTGVPQEGDDPQNPSSYDKWSYTKQGGRWVATSERDDNPPTGQL